MKLSHVLLGTFLAATTVSALADPHFLTDNYTPNWSTVKVTSGALKGMCAGIFSSTAKTGPVSPDGTPGHGDVDWGVVKRLCFGSGAVCTADVYPDQTCSSNKIGEASMDLSNGSISVKSTSSVFKFDAEPYHLVLRCADNSITFKN